MAGHYVSGVYLPCEKAAISSTKTLTGVAVEARRTSKAALDPGAPSLSTSGSRAQIQPMPSSDRSWGSRLGSASVDDVVYGKHE